MNASADTMEGMTWWDYVQKHAAGAPNSHIAQKVGITPPSVGRWSKPGGRPDPAQAATFAREYGRPVLEAFIAAGFLTSEEAGERPSAPPSLASLSDDELLAEVRHRMQGGQHEDTATRPAQKNGGPSLTAIVGDDEDAGYGSEGWGENADLAARREDPRRDK